MSISKQLRCHNCGLEPLMDWPHPERPLRTPILAEVWRDLRDNTIRAREHLCNGGGRDLHPQIKKNSFDKDIYDLIIDRFGVGAEDEVTVTKE